MCNSNCMNQPREQCITINENEMGYVGISLTDNTKLQYFDSLLFISN